METPDAAIQRRYDWNWYALGSCTLLVSLLVILLAPSPEVQRPQAVFAVTFLFIWGWIAAALRRCAAGHRPTSSGCAAPSA